MNDQKRKEGGQLTYDPTLDYNGLVDQYLETCGREQTKLPKTSEFAREYLHRSEDALEDWLKSGDKPELSGAIKRIKDAQKEQLIDDGLYGGKEINSAMAIFLLKANHGLIETERKMLVGKDGSALELFVNAGQGFLPATIGLPTAPAGGVTEGQSQVQGVGVAPSGTENHDSNSGTS